MKLFRKLRAFALLVAVLALVTGFVVLHAPKPADANRCDCLVRICTLEPPFYCWCECRPCPPPPPPGPPGPE